MLVVPKSLPCAESSKSLHVFLPPSLSQSNAGTSPLQATSCPCAHHGGPTSLASSEESLSPVSPRPNGTSVRLGVGGKRASRLVGPWRAGTLVTSSAAGRCVSTGRRSPSSTMRPGPSVGDVACWRSSRHSCCLASALSRASSAAAFARCRCRAATTAAAGLGAGLQGDKRCAHLRAGSGCASRSSAEAVHPTGASREFSPASLG
mmetsp:Transcript_47929/g.133179  ORF Transcript_47929/g.133179 Transcript_47929/m.133179 type:complete len:205 (-) Transcript_47929:1004-1618(-)